MWGWIWCRHLTVTCFQIAHLCCKAFLFYVWEIFSYNVVSHIIVIFLYFSFEIEKETELPSVQLIFTVSLCRYCSTWTVLSSIHVQPISDSSITNTSWKRCLSHAISDLFSQELHQLLLLVIVEKWFSVSSMQWGMHILFTASLVYQ